MGLFWYTSMHAVTLCKNDLYLFYELKFGILISCMENSWDWKSQAQGHVLTLRGTDNKSRYLAPSDV